MPNYRSTLSVGQRVSRGVHWLDVNVSGWRADALLVRSLVAVPPYAGWEVEYLKRWIIMANPRGSVFEWAVDHGFEADGPDIDRDYRRLHAEWSDVLGLRAALGDPTPGEGER